MDSKSTFVKEVARCYNLSYVHVNTRWLQKDWTIPEENLPQIIGMAQMYLYLQNQRKMAVLRDTGFDFKKVNQL
ncbi:hypothetical protein J2Q11_12300 [Tenacibaculum finnmarkense genomovar finnmarkense]|uniref:hypothetical protein n=1 Tax=Tenacibaculum finnmarkense TaxID=2781243 RepID=UPI001EFA60FB|nr:hypothetical protein [Tenacibaculum finnmarkense]MCG8213594.1 hypothetical protein [Tenacibaculum finnmarkense genomovar finnmarkense]MCG8231911.1 hypothetical protein [Tenacibaculum finnmarkense genomovar finnmarkense]MCG8886475.1 hypothetical protein [Tenacibaculum finnmarkense]MCG8897257.1 hypothetical protein [Tenacibaculum finnmarkense]MCG8903965.1 hypothetical protein [Tenacibaculum finnmarkense]